jgi:hypothetical protein
MLFHVLVVYSFILLNSVQLTLFIITYFSTHHEYLLQFRVITNEAAMNILVHLICRHMLPFPWVKIQDRNFKVIGVCIFHFVKTTT